MTKDILRLELKDFRVIKEANIKLNGITLVSGINGCGKSTISKMLYHLVEGINDYNKLVGSSDPIRLAKFRLGDCLYSLSTFLSDIIGKDSKVFYTWDFLDDEEKLENALREVYTEYELIADSISKQQEERIIEILSEYATGSEDNTIDGLWRILWDGSEAIQKQIESLQKQRPSKIVFSFIQSIFGSSDFNSATTNLFNAEALVLGLDEEKVHSHLSVRRGIYIDSPFALNTNIGSVATWKSYEVYWDKLNKLLKEQNPINYPSSTIYAGLDVQMEEDLLHGESSWDESKREYMFTREDGSKFNLLDCATGERSLSILQMLLKNGWLDKSTLLIIDEPEVHLHPQWVVEYARLIVLLNKEIGVKFFLASHNPDLVSAIKHISEKEKLGEALNFYLAEKSKDNYKFIYRELGQDIEPIFESFNIALDRIDAYGRTQEEY